MYKKNKFASRKLPGWVERRNYFRRVIEWMRVEATGLEVAPVEIVPVASPTKRR